MVLFGVVEEIKVVDINNQDRKLQNISKVFKIGILHIGEVVVAYGCFILTAPLFNITLQHIDISV